MPPAILKAFRCQLAASFLVFCASQLNLLAHLEALPLAAFQGLCASFMALLWKSDRWWPPIHLVFVPAAVLISQLHIPSETYALCFFLLLGFYWTSFRTRVPLFLSNRATVHKLAAQLTYGAGANVLDIGSGTGCFVSRLAKLRPDWQISGIELAPFPLWISKWRTRKSRNISIERQDFWQKNLHSYDLVYAFLSPDPMKTLWEKARHEMRSGSMLISNSFPIPNTAPEKIIPVGDRRQTLLYCYRIPGTTAPLANRAGLATHLDLSR